MVLVGGFGRWRREEVYNVRAQQEDRSVQTHRDVAGELGLVSGKVPAHFGTGKLGGYNGYFGEKVPTPPGTHPRMLSLPSACFSLSQKFSPKPSIYTVLSPPPQHLQLLAMPMPPAPQIGDTHP
ncbi:hypothetical protein FH972_019916 [Carpinus fangiana]|uniref:Uncharacterized protein n=1 Tax=Carpinus fangiana TaxID=176857 RepID=A0A5N6RUU1_9ROSI|nr:hypothetical protein FH972_019916 [Carpinus fangiana]